MPERITFSLPPEDTLLGPQEAIPESSGFVPPAPYSGEPAPEFAPVDTGFVPPPPGSGEPAPEMRGAWEQRVDALAHGIGQADMMLNVFGGMFAGSKKDRLSDQQLELLRQDERDIEDEKLEIQQRLEAIERDNPDAPPELVEKVVNEIKDRYAKRKERFTDRRTEIEEILRAQVDEADETIELKAKNFAIMQQAMEDIPKSEVMKKFEKAEGAGEALEVLLRNPVGAIDLMLESLPASAGALGLGFGLGIATGSPQVVAAGMFFAEGAPEAAGAMIEVMSENGVDLSDPAQVAVFMKDPKMRALAYDRGWKKGATIGGIGAIFQGFAGHFLKKAIKKGAGTIRKGGATILDVGVQIAGEGVAEGVSGGDGKDIIAEMGGAGGNASVGIAANVVIETTKARDEVVDPVMEIVREATEKLAQASQVLEVAKAAEEENAQKAGGIGAEAVAAVTADPTNLEDADDIAAAQRDIEEETNQAIKDQEEIKAAAEAAAQEAAQAMEELVAAQELLQSDEVRALQQDVDDAEQLSLHFETAQELEKTNPEAAAMMRHPKAAELYEAQKDTLPGNIFIELQEADGSVVPGLFSGYFSPTHVSFGRYAPNEGGFSHGIITPEASGQTILTPIPSFEEWTAAQEAKQVGTEVDPNAPTVAVTAEEAAGSTATPIEPETFTLQGEQVVDRQAAELQAAEQRRVAIEDGTLDQAAEAEALAAAEAVAANDAAGEAEVLAQDLAQQAELEDEAEVEATIREAAEIAADEAAAAGFVPPPPNTGEPAPETGGNIGGGESVPIMGPETQARLDAEQPLTTEERLAQPLQPEELPEAFEGAAQPDVQKTVEPVVETPAAPVEEAETLTPEADRNRQRFAIPPIVSEMVKTGVEAGRAIADRISNVQLAQFQEGQTNERITFELDGETYEGELVGRNADLVVGAGDIEDSAIAARVLVDGNATPVEPTAPVEPTPVRFEVDEVLNIADPDGTPSGTATYRGPDPTDPNKSVVWTGRSQISVNNRQLTRPVEETATPEQRANLIDLNLLDKFIENVDGDVMNLASPGTLTRRIKRALDKGWITPEEAAEIKRIQKEMGSRDDTQDAFEELRTTLEFKREEIQGQTTPEGGQLEEGQETFGTEFPVDTMTVAAKRKLLRPEISRILPNGVVANLPIEELQSIRTVTGAQRLRRIYTSQVTSQEVAAVAQFGEAGRFWYQDFRAMMEAMNVPPEQEYILAGVLAATSPNKSVRQNVEWTVKVLRAWQEAGSPTDNDSVVNALSTLKPKMWGSDFGNTVAVLTNQDFESAIGGMSDQSPKVKPFFEALMGNENAVVLDTHMARFFGLRQSKMGKANINRALTARIRNIAGRLGWTAAQTQAAIWAVARHYGNAISPSVGPNVTGRSKVPGIMNQPVTNDVLLRNDDIATLLTEDFANDFTELGFDTAAGARSIARTRASRPTTTGGRGQTLGVSHQRTLGRRLETRYLDDRARKNGQPVASDSLAESTEEYGNDYADTLEITDPERRAGAMGYVEAAIDGETETGPEYTATDEAAPVTDLDAEMLLGPVGIVTENARKRLSAGERISVILAAHVKGIQKAFDMVGAVIQSTQDFVQAQMAMRSPYQESVKIAFVDEANRVIHSETLSMGSLLNVPISPELVEAAYQRAREKGATERKFFIAHNHPSGNTSPSAADLAHQAILEDWVAEVGGSMEDFVITNGNDFHSMKSGEKIALTEPNRAAWEGVPIGDRRRLRTGRQMSAMVAVLRQGNPEAEFIVYTNNQLVVMAVEQVPPGLSAAEWAQRATEGARLSAATGVNLVTAQGETEALGIVNAISPSGLLIQDVSSNDRPSWYGSGVLAEGALVKGAERRIATGLAEDQLEFGLDPEEVKKAAAPHKVVPPPPPPPPSKSAESSVKSAIDATGTAPDAAVSLNQKFPGVEISQWNVADLDDASTEAIDAEGLSLIENADKNDLQELGIKKTQLFGKMMTILGRRGLTEAERLRATQRASRAFTEAGLEVEFDAENEVYRLANPSEPNEIGGRALVDILQREIKLGADQGRPFLSVLINSVRNKDGGMWVSPAFSESTRNQLFSLAQGEASFYGLMLGALHRHKRSLNFVASHVDVYLNRAYSKAFGGEAIGGMLGRVRDIATEEATEDLHKKVSQKMKGVLDRLDSMNQQGVDLDYYMGQVLDQIGKGERTAREVADIDQLPSLFDLANWRMMITQKGGNQLATNILRMINPQETEADAIVEGNVKRMDRLLQNDLNKIVKEVIPQIAKERQEPNFLQDLMTATGDEQTRTERLDLVDQRVRDGLDAAEETEMNDENADTEAVAEKYEQIREQWDEQFTQISSSLSSESMVRRIVNQHLKEVFAELNIKWGDVAKGQASIAELRDALERRIEQSFNDFNDQAPEAAIDPAKAEQMLRILSDGFEQMARSKIDNIRANQAAAVARRKAELPQRTAEGELNRLATLHSDVQEWTTAEENAVKEAIARQRKTPASPEVFEETLIGLGVSQPTARSLSGIVNKDIDARRRHEQLRRERRVASPRPERGNQEDQERKTGIKGLVDRIFAAPPKQQNDVRWQRRTALAYFQENGLSEAEAEDAWNTFKPDFIGLLKQAAKRGLEQMRNNLSSRETKLINAKKGSKQLWQRLEESINAGVFEQAEILKQFAKEFGWIVPTEAQVQTLKALSAREQELSAPTEDERQQIENSVLKGRRMFDLSQGEQVAVQGEIAEKVEAARVMKAAGTLNERLRIQNRMHSLYAQFSRPITWKTPEGRKNFGEAGREFISANMLFKLGFGVKQVIDVGTQWAFHMPARALAHSITRAQETRKGGQPTMFWSDLSGALGDTYENLGTFAKQAMIQWRQAMRGEGVRRNIEGMRSTISGFDRMKAHIIRNRQEIEDIQSRANPFTAEGLAELNRAADLGMKNFVFHLMGFAEWSLRFTRAMDNIQGVFVEQQEIRERLISELMRNGYTAIEARTSAGEILMDWRREQDLSLMRAKQVADENNLDINPTELRASAYEIFKSQQYSRIKSAGLDANQIAEFTETQRQTVGWNMPEETGVGGVVGLTVRKFGREAERQGLPLPIGQFSNAIAIGINRALTWTPAGYFPGFFGGVNENQEGSNAWFRTPTDQNHRKIEAIIGSTAAIGLIALAIKGGIRIWLKPPDDPEERRVWQKEGHRAGTVEFHSPFSNSFIPVSLTSGPMSFFRIPLSAIGAVQDVIASRERRKTRLVSEAELRGLPVGEFNELTLEDMGAAASLGAFQAMLGGRTAGGALRSFKAGTDRDLITLQTTIASQVSPMIIGLPAFQEAQRGREIRLDPSQSNVLDLMFPTQESGKRIYNFLSDELGPGFTQQMTQTLTGGTFGPVNPDKLDADNAYKIFRQITYRPSPIERQKGMLINGTWGVLDDETYSKVQFKRGKILKELMQEIPPDLDPQTLTNAARSAAAESKYRALQTINAEEIELEPTEGGIKTMPQQAQELFREIEMLPDADQLQAFRAAVDEGRVPLQNGDPHPIFLKEWRTLKQNSIPVSRSR